MKVLIAYDGSEGADAALNDLSWAGLPGDVDAQVLTTYEAGFLERDSRQFAAVQDAAVAISERAVARVRRAWPNWRVTVREAHGSAASCVLERAHAWQADLIVLGSHGRSALGRIVLGSVSHHVATHARCSVRLARQQHPPGRDGARVVVGLDGSPESEVALGEVLRRTWAPGSRARLVTAMHVPIPEEFRSVDLLEHREARLRDVVERVNASTRNAAGRFAEMNMSVDAVTCDGEAARVLVDEAKSFGADSIFVGVRAGHKLGRFVLGSISAAVATTAHCSVEIVRDAEH